MSYSRPISDGNGDSSASAGDRTSNNLSAQVAGYSGAERAAAYSNMSPNGGEQYLPSLNLSNYENVANIGSPQSATGSDNNGTNTATQNNSDTAVVQLPPNNGGGGDNRWQNQNGGGGDNQWQNQNGGGGDNQWQNQNGGGGDNRWQNQNGGGGGDNQWRHRRYEPGPGPTPEPGPTPPEPTPEPGPQPTPTTLAGQEAQDVSNGVTQIDNAVQTGNIATGYGDMQQLLTQWKSQEPNDAASMESQLMQSLANTSTSDGMSGNDVIKDLGVNEVAALFPLFSSGGQVTAASLIADSELNSDPANKALIGGAAQWMEQAGMTGGVSNSVFFAGDIANGAQNVQQYQNYVDQPKASPDYATTAQQGTSSDSADTQVS